MPLKRGFIMANLVVESKELIRKNYPRIGYGSEAEVFAFDEATALKVFIDDPIIQANLENKLNKIKILMENSINGVVFPKKLVFDDSGQFIGYTMSLITPKEPISDLRYVSRSKLSLEEKINIYLKIEEIVSCLHEIGIFLIDTNPLNFLIVSQNQVALIDTDNFTVGDFKSDILPKSYAQTYIKATGDYTLKYCDEFSLLIRLIEILLPRFDKRKREAILVFGIGYLENLINTIDMPVILKNKILEILLIQEKKEFIGPYLNCISNPNERYLRRKNSSLH